MSPKPPTDCIQRGIEWLNEAFGSDAWQQRIDLTTLDMWDGNACVVAQATGDYHSALSDTDIVMRIRLGFTLASDDDDEWRALTNAWKERLHDARTNAPTSGEGQTSKAGAEAPGASPATDGHQTAVDLGSPGQENNGTVDPGAA